MIWAVMLALATVIASGTYLSFSRDVLRCVIGLALLGNGINLLLFTAGRLESSAPPVIGELELILPDAANALPQALVLTAVVIGFALLCLSLVLAISLIHLSGSDDLLEIRSAEPPAVDRVKPALEDDR
ncbi:MAG: NADH-quinone oxidoreductase subunit K [bacterium]|nr:NADH-quinone oxidoreductase subunit K [bacterium]